MATDLTHHFDTENGQVLYFPDFVRDKGDVMRRMVELGKVLRFPRTGQRVRGGLSATGEEYLITERTASARGGVPGVKWENTPVETMADEITRFAHARNLIPLDRRVDYCLYNLYETGRDVIYGHSDSERNSLPINLSVTLGYPRTFVFTHTRTKDQLVLSPGDGSLLVFRGDINTRYTHCVPPESVPRGESGRRVNLTFRVTTPEVRDVPTAISTVPAPDVRFTSVVVGGHKRSFFCDDFHFATPGEALGRTDCIMYKNWGIVGTVCVDKDRIRAKINRMRDRTRVFGSSDWFIVPGSLSRLELEARFLALGPYMRWKFPKMACYRPRQVNAKVFADVYNRMPAKGPDRTTRVILEKVVGA